MFASPEPLTPKALFKLLDSEPREDVERALASLKADYRPERGLQIVEIAGGLQIVTRTDLHEWVRRLFHERKTSKLSVQALETLAVVAYRQPVTAAEITEIRGVNTVRRARHAHRAQAGEDCRAQARRRAAVPLRDHARVPDAVRPQRPDRPPEGRGSGRGPGFEIPRGWARPVRATSSCRSRLPGGCRRSRRRPRLSWSGRTMTRW